MSIDIFCLAVAMFLAFFPKIPLIIWLRKNSRLDLRYGRLQQAQFTGFAARAQGAHQNSLEGFPLFAAALLAARLQMADPVKIDILAISYCLARVAFIAAYLADAPRIRSLFWFAGMACVVALLAISL